MRSKYVSAAQIAGVGSPRLADFLKRAHVEQIISWLEHRKVRQPDKAAAYDTVIDDLRTEYML